MDDGQARVERLLAAVGLAERADESVRAFSGGMRRRLEIARGLLARPTVLFLDEPTLGLDPIARRDLCRSRPRGGDPMSDTLAGFVPLYQRRLSLALKTPIGPISQALTPVLWVLIVGPAMAASEVGPSQGFFSYIAIGQIAFILPFSAMFAGLTVLNDRNFGSTLIPAIGATPYLLCGALYPISKLPDGVRQAFLILPHTHAIALLRDGFVGSHQSDLDAIWHLHSHLAMSLLSLAVLAIWAIGAALVAIRAFRRATLS